MVKTFTITEKDIEKGAKELAKPILERSAITHICPAALCFKKAGYPGAYLGTWNVYLKGPIEALLPTPIEVPYPENLRNWIAEFDRKSTSDRLLMQPITFEIDLPY